MQARLVPITQLIPDPHNPRHHTDTESDRQFTESIKQHGILMPLIVYPHEDKYMIGDGHQRFTSALQLNLREVPVVIYPRQPSEAERLLFQLSVAAHRQSLNPVDEYEAFVRLAKLHGWNATQLATQLSVSNSEITRIQAIGKLTPQERQLVREGKISKSSAYALTRMTGAERVAFAHQAAAGQVTRDELNDKARKKSGNPTVKTARLSLHLAGHVVTVQTPDGIHISGLLNLLESLVKEAKKSLKEGIDVSTFARVLKDRARVQPITEGASS